MKIIDNKLRYNSNEIIIETDEGTKKISYSDAFEIAWSLFDATGYINKETEVFFEKIDKEYHLDKY